MEVIIAGVTLLLTKMPPKLIAVRELLIPTG